MDTTWIIYTTITIIYIVILVIYFLKRSKNHEKELKEFLDLAQQQLDEHKQITSSKADQKVSQALLVVKQVQQAARAFEDEVQKEYQQIIEDAKAEKRELLAKTKSEIEEIFKQADKDLKEYQASRHEEIERNLVKLVVSVTEKVVDQSLEPKKHEDIINKSIKEIMQDRARSK